MYRYPPDPDVSQELTEASLIRRRQQLKRRSEEFLKGPIPLVWLRRASRLRGRALAVGIALWFKSGVTRSRRVKLTHALLQRAGVPSRAGLRGLRLLAQDGLVTADIRTGSCPVVTILDVTPGE